MHSSETRPQKEGVPPKVIFIFKLDNIRYVENNKLLQ